MELTEINTYIVIGFGAVSFVCFVLSEILAQIPEKYIKANSVLQAIVNIIKSIGSMFKPPSAPLATTTNATATSSTGVTTKTSTVGGTV